MKKWYKINYTLLAMMAIFCVGCKDFLSMEPDSTRAVIDSPQKVSQLLATAYPQAGYVVFAESMSDNVADKGKGEVDLTNIGSYKFEEINSNPEEGDSPDLYWVACYRAISVANEALNIISKSSDPIKYQSQKGEALVARAYAHFMLVNYFSKTYNVNTASTDLGIPYVTEPENVIFKKYERKTVAYVYEMIEKDLLEGMPLIVDGSYSVPKYHFNRNATKAFAARYYLMKKDYQKVVNYVNEAFAEDEITDNLRPWNTVMSAMSPDQLTNIFAKSTMNANLLIAETYSLIGRYIEAYRYGMTYEKNLEIFSNSRLIAGSARWVFPIYTRGDNNYFVPKWYEYFVRASVNAVIGEPYVMLTLFTVEEMLFNRAEANVRLGNYDEALLDLNRYTSKRIPNYNPVNHSVTMSKIKSYFPNTTNETGLIETVLSFKRSEFAQEGMRWLDMQRHEIPVTHTTVDGSTITIPANDPRRVLQIPQTALISGIEKNPR